MVAKWGNPDTKAFARQNLRYARYGDTAVQVHRLIWPLVEHMFNRFEEAGISVTLVAPLSDPMHKGFHLPGASAEAISRELLVGFVLEGDVVHWVGSAADAEAASKAISEASTEDEPEPEPVPADAPRPEALPAPLSRDIGDEEVVRFIQTLTGAPVTGQWSPETESFVADWRERMGAPVLEGEGLAGDGFWLAVIPKRLKWLRPGATGREVKVLQAAFKVRGYYDAPVDGKWGVNMSRALRVFQHDYRIHPRLRIGSPEWEALFGPRGAANKS